MNYEIRGKKLIAVAIIVLAGVSGLAWIFWRRETAAAQLSPLNNPRLVIEKSRRQLQLFDAEKLVKTYQISLGFAPTGDKEIEGDGKTPEGEFYIVVKNPNSKFYRSLGLNYPNAEDAARGLQNNLISQTEHDAIVQAVAENRLPPQRTALGGEIYIHGGGTTRDWTAGCIALDNEQIQELFDALAPGVSVLIKK